MDETMQTPTQQPPQPCACQPPGFWQLFALSLGLSLLFTWLAVRHQRQQKLSSH